jgi:hypothetical protein
VFHTDLLTPYHETLTHGANYQRPLPDLVGGVEEYEVEKVLDSRRYRTWAQTTVPHHVERLSRL